MAQYVDLMMRRYKEAEDKIIRLEKEANAETETEGKKLAARTLTPEIESDINAIYEGAVAKWYGAYTPKRYPRSEPGSLYGVMRLNRVDGIHSGWEYFDDGLNKPSFSKKHPKTFNIYDLVFKQGYHGGWIGSHSPTRSAPIPDMFVTGYYEYASDTVPVKYKDKFNGLVDQYFNENAYNAVKRKVKEKYGSELDWLLP